MKSVADLYGLLEPTTCPLEKRNKATVSNRDYNSLRLKQELLVRHRHLAPLLMGGAQIADNNRKSVGGAAEVLASDTAALEAGPLGGNAGEVRRHERRLPVAKIG